MSVGSAERERRVTAVADAEQPVGCRETALRVVIADNSYVFREGLSYLLTESSALNVVATYEDACSLLEAIERDSPDVVLSDAHVPPVHERASVRLAEQLRETRPDIGVVILSRHADLRLALELFESGSEGRAYLLKERVDDRGELVAAIQAVADRRSVVDPSIVDGLIAERARPPASPLDELTRREREVLAEVATGKSNAAIASSLFLTKRAVEKHINAIFMKLNLRDTGYTSRRVKATLMFVADPNSRARLPEI